MKRTTTNLLVLLIVIGTNTLSAAGLKIGISANYNYSTYDNMKFPGVSCFCYPFKDGTGHGYSLGLAVELFQNTFFIDSWVFRLGMQNLPVSEVNLDHEIVMVDFEGKYLDAVFKDEMKVDYSSIVMDFMYKLSFFETGFFVSAGPSFSYNYNNNLLMKEYAPDGAYYINEDGKLVNSRELYNDKIPDFNKIRIAIKGGLSYDFLFENYGISVGAFYNFPISKVNDTGWKIGALQIGADFMLIL
jgi:hypothetical protein